jgi:LmbE family N-acetylglucosaminyl deacetylase
MLALTLNQAARLQRLLCLGAHCDDIEIGCGGTLLALLAANPAIRVDWVVFSSDPVRKREASASAAAFLGGGPDHRVAIHSFRNGYFPSVAAEIKDVFEQLKSVCTPDLVLSHHRADFHQDHRVLGELTWNTFRNHLILEYEIPKYDGDLGRPNVFVPLPDEIRTRKVDLVLRNFASQQGKQWWSAETFNALMRLRGIECNAASGYAEAYYGAKVSLSF